MQENEDPILVGRFVGVYGVQGWLKIDSYTRPKDNIFTYSPWFVRVDRDWQKVEIEEFQQRGSGQLLVKMVGTNTPEQARVYTSCDIAVVQQQFPALKEGEFYWHDLIGLEVINQDQLNLGKISDILETGANDVLVVKKTCDKITKTLIPLVMDVFVKKVDLIAKTMHVEWQSED
jgi:16S rRNA processing protein RimM